MEKSSIFSSIRLKFILFFVLLILIAMQIIGVYFVRELEVKLTDNFKNSILNRVNLLKYNIEQEFIVERDEDGLESLRTEIRSLLYENKSNDIHLIMVYDKNSRVLATSDYNNQGIVGQKTTDKNVSRTIVTASTIQNTLQNDNHELELYLYVMIHVNEQIA